MTRPLILFVVSALLSFNMIAYSDWYPGINASPAEYSDVENFNLIMTGAYECNLTITIPGIEIAESYDGYQLKLEGLNSIGGGPMVCGYLSMPGQSNLWAEITNLQTAEYDIDAAILNMTEVSGGSDDLEFESGTIFFGKPQILRDLRIIPVSIKPYRINYNSNKLVVTRELSIEFGFSEGHPLNPKQKFRFQRSN